MDAGAWLRASAAVTALAALVVAASGQEAAAKRPHCAGGRATELVDPVKLFALGTQRDDVIAGTPAGEREFHGIEVPDPYWALLMDWRSELYGAASHRWAIGARSWEVIPRMRRPLPEVPIHVCGEAWSDLQGWTEGALRSAERVLRDELGLDPPGWMSKDAYLGP